MYGHVVHTRTPIPGVVACLRLAGPPHLGIYYQLAPKAYKFESHFALNYPKRQSNSKIKVARMLSTSVCQRPWDLIPLGVESRKASEQLKDRSR